MSNRNLIHSKRFIALVGAASVCLFLLVLLDKSVQPHEGEVHETYPTGGATEGPKTLSPQAKANIDLKTEAVDLHTIEEVVHVTGSVKAKPKQLAHVTPRIGGIVQRVYFNLGDRVQKGKPLLELESLELQADQIHLIQASKRAKQLKNTFDNLKTVSAKKLRLELTNRGIDYVESLTDVRRREAALAQLKAVSVGKIKTKLEQMRVELVKANVELQLLEASLKRVEALAEKRIPAKKELIEKQAEYAKGVNELEGAKRQFRLLGVKEGTIEQILHSSGDAPILSLLSDGAESDDRGLEKYTPLLEGAAELVTAESESQAAVIKVETSKQRLLATSVTEAQIRELADTGTITSLRDMPIDTLIENHLALLEDPGVLVERESAYQEAEIELNGTMRRLQALGLTTSELNEVIEKGEPRHQLTVTAPVSGQIVEQGATLGATVEPNNTLFQILDTTTVLVEGDVLADALASIQVGQDVRIRSAAYPQAVFTGKVFAISDVMDTEKRTAHLWVDVDNPERKLKPGMFAELRVVTARKAEVIAVPLAAVLDEGAEKFVFVEEGDTYTKREIVLGAKDDQFIEVKEGLFPGDIVVVQGNHELMSASGPSKVPLAADGHAHQH